MKHSELIEKAGIEVVEGGPFGYMDFGPAWVSLYDMQLSVVTRIEDQTVVMVEWFKEETSELYSWVNPDISNNMREENVDSVTVLAIQTADEVLNMWSSFKADNERPDMFPRVEEK
jgi:hypothetical protein